MSIGSITLLSYYFSVKLVKSDATEQKIKKKTVFL